MSRNKVLTASSLVDLPFPQSTITSHHDLLQERKKSRSHNPQQVRCDAASLGVPCTNCVAFSIECRIPQTKRKKPQSTAAGPKDSDRYGERRAIHRAMRCD